LHSCKYLFKKAQGRAAEERRKRKPDPVRSLRLLGLLLNTTKQVLKCSLLKVRFLPFLFKKRQDRVEEERRKRNSLGPEKDCHFYYYLYSKIVRSSIKFFYFNKKFPSITEAMLSLFIVLNQSTPVVPL